ncbi:MAG TPA: class I SAM-dependent methyltransferase [Methylomirabilota bacterium]|nr:class I SAM-dependent methyltransferase [Methylomirabilota bacterium]
MQPQAVSDKVSPERWQQAQDWERNHWVGAQRARGRFGKNWVWRLLSTVGVVPKYRGDDWNLWWKQRFDDYRFLPPTVENAIEVGCGPYTNIRLMLERCRPRHLVLSDPLIRTYVKFKLTFVAEMYREAACMLDDHPLEELPFADSYFDLAVMINVLDHVQDAHRCMTSLLRVIKPGGFLVLGQDLTSAEDAARLQGAPGEIGHPVWLNDEWFKPYLSDRFDPIINRVLSREEGRSSEHHYGTLLFAGRRLPPSGR